MRFLLCLVLAFLVPTTGVFAQDTADFNIRVFGAEDTIAPSTPTLSGSAITANQIDISWTVSTDNYLVSGYVLYRDGSPISTTTQTSYSDVSVLASSTYAYTVRAFDTSFNYSSSSNLVSITTPAEPVTPVDQGNGGTGGTSARVVLNELTITPGFSTSTLYMRTARPARFEMRWGKTGAYELGYIVNDRFLDEYQTTLTELEPGTTYFYEVVGYTPFGIATVLEQGKFKTLDMTDFLSPSNVLRFTGYQENQDVRLSWQNPPVGNFASVRIVRSHLGFPAHPQDGVIVYQGTTEGYTDRDILAQHSPVYYTAFVYDTAGNVSSGSIVRVYLAGAGAPDIATPVTPPLTGDGDIAPTDGYASTSPTLPPGTKMPDLSQIFLLQNNKEQSFAESTLTLTSANQFVVSIPKEAVTVNLKTIIVTMTDPTDSRKTYSVLLKLNKDKTAYEAVIGALMVEGLSQVTIDIYDYSAQVVGTYRKTVAFEAGRGGEVVPVFPDLFIAKLPLILLTLLPFLFGVFFWLFYRRRKRPHEDNNW